MKKVSLLLVALFLGIVCVNAQNTTFNKGDQVVNLGIGLGSTLYVGSGYSTSIPPISVSYEKGMKDELFDENSSLGVGGYLGYTSAKWKYSGHDWGWKYSSFILGARGAVHYQFIEKLDTYGGIMLGYNIRTAKEYGDWGNNTIASASSSGFLWSGYVGGRYYFKEKMSAFAELGYGVAYLTVGISLKL